MTKKILSFSGGGCRGLYQAAYLFELSANQNLKQPLWQNFDVIAGTSIGSILAFVVALDKDIYDFYTLFKKTLQIYLSLLV